MSRKTMFSALLAVAVGATVMIGGQSLAAASTTPRPSAGPATAEPTPAEPAPTRAAEDPRPTAATAPAPTDARPADPVRARPKFTG